LNEHFLDVFVPEGGRLLKVQAALYLELKTQAFIAAMNTKSRTRTQLLYELFPDDMEQRLLARRPGTRQLAPSETDFVNRLTSRRDILLNDINNEEALKALPDKYHWEDFLRDLSSYIAKNFDAINTQQVRLHNFHYLKISLIGFIGKEAYQGPSTIQLQWRCTGYTQHYSPGSIPCQPAG
jgi:hypothetical protein